jgi:hypothetical protein
VYFFAGEVRGFCEEIPLGWTRYLRERCGLSKKKKLYNKRKEEVRGLGWFSFWGGPGTWATTLFNSLGTQTVYLGFCFSLHDNRVYIQESEGEGKGSYLEDSGPGAGASPVPSG